MLDFTHDPHATSWLESANAPDCDFPVQNLPFGRFRRAATSEEFRIGVAIGDQILDLAALGQLDPDLLKLLGPLARGDLNEFMAHGRAARIALRHALFEGLAARPSGTASLWQARRESLLVPMRQRIRDVRQGPDQLLYLLTDDAKDGALLRIEPAS